MAENTKGVKEELGQCVNSQVITDKELGGQSQQEHVYM